MFWDWHPQVVHDLHESVALLLTWNGTGPINEHVDPLTYAERLELSFHEVQAMTGLGMPGVWTWNFGDDFAHLYLDAIATNHNADGRGYETYGNGTAETLVPEQPGDEHAVEWYRPLPPPSENLPLVGARQRQLQRDRAAGGARRHRAAVADAAAGTITSRACIPTPRARAPPYGFLIPDGQGDPTRVAQLVARLLTLGIEVQRARCAVHPQGGELSRRHLRGAARSAVPRLRRRPADPAELPEGRR